MTTEEQKTTNSLKKMTTKELDTTISEGKNISDYARGIAPDNTPVEQIYFTVNGTSVKLTWNQDVCREHKYEVCCWTSEEDKRTTRTSSKSYTFTKLKCGETYFASVTHIDGQGHYSSAPSNTVEFCTAPKAPTNLYAEIYEANPQECIIISFEDKNDWNVKHEVTITPIDEGEGGAGKKTKQTTNRRVFFTGLQPGQSYTVSAFTINEHKDGDQTTRPKRPIGSATQSDAGASSGSVDGGQSTTNQIQASKTVYGDHIVTTYPSTPEGVHHNPDTRERLEITWDEPVIKPLKYHIYWEENDEKHENDYSTAKSFSITNLKPSTTYRYKVASINSAGISKFSEEGKYVTAPAAPVNVVAMKNPHNRETSFIVRFDDPDPTPKKYKITAESTDETVCEEIETESHTAVLNGLDPGRPYSIYVVAISMVDGEKKSGRAYFKKTDVKMD